MALNTELFAKIYDIITDGDGVPRRQTFSMDTWEHSCGTSRCVAGWAVHLETGQPLFERDGGAHRSTLDLAQELGLWTSPLSWEHLGAALLRSEEHTSELQSLMRISYAVFCL